MKAWPIAFAAVFPLMGCAARPTPPPRVAVVEAVAEVGLPQSWRKVATSADAARIDTLSDRWARGLANADPLARKAEGSLLDPAAALEAPAPSPGAYRCRMIKLGQAGRRGRSLRTYKPFFCFIEAEGSLLTFAKASGSERPAGRFWEDNEKRLVFLGAMAPDPDAPPPAYGADPAHDRIGVIERVGEFRWRMALLPHNGNALLDVIELVPNATAAMLAPPAG